MDLERLKSDLCDNCHVNLVHIFHQYKLKYNCEEIFECRLHKVLDESVVVNLRHALPADVKIKVSDGEVWANKALLSASADYFSAMLDGEKFQEGQEGVGSLEKYNKEVVIKLIHYFYCGEMSCQVNLSIYVI